MPRSSAAIFVYSCFFLLSFTSCVDNEPIIDEARVSAVFDYSEETVGARLSVFASVRSDLDLAAELRLINEDADLQWSCQHLTKFSDSSNTDWVGYSAFVAPEGAPIPKGKYLLTYEDSCEREGELVFTVDYPDSLLEKLFDTPQWDSPPASDGAASTTAVVGGEPIGEEGFLASDEATSTTEVVSCEPIEEAPPSASGSVDGISAVDPNPSTEEVSTQASDGAANIVALDEATQDDRDAPLAGDQLDTSSAMEQDDQHELDVRHTRNDGFKHKTIDEVRGILGDGVQAKIALYSSERVLLYFGDDEDDLLEHYKDAAFSKTCLCTQDDAVICIFSETPVQH